MRSVTIFGLVLAAICGACGAKMVSLGEDPRTAEGGSQTDGGTDAVGSGGARGGPAESEGLGGMIEKRKGNGDIGGLDKSGTGGTTRPTTSPTGDPTPEPLPPRDAGTDLAGILSHIQELAIHANTKSCQCTCLDDPRFCDCSNVSVDFSLYVSPDFNGYNPPPIARCTTKILTATSLGDASVKCEEKTLADFVTCLDAANCAPDSRCAQDFEQAQSLCPVVPYDLDAKIFSECLGSPLPAPMVCNDGTRIHSTLVCNGKADCSNGEDERSTYCGP
jgi:hypothetical protein